ncbi:Digeranylgeranylglycerophospholipid reductase [uncultured archaeon]|nr:Digeranylgeranylglycerophospholipid reductase [uncultured archaeon]
MDEYDVIVVGAGPAGATAAFFIKYHDKSKRVLLIDKLEGERYNTYHRICGEAIRAITIDELSPLVIDGIVERIYLVREIFGRNKIELPAHGLLVNRVIMLKSIIEQFKRLGGEYKNSRFLGLEVKDDKIIVETNEGMLRTKYLIGADGAHSTVRKMLNIPDPSICFATQYIIDKEPVHGVLEFYFDKNYKSNYKWIFANGNTTKIGVLAGSLNKEEIDGKILQKQSRSIAFGGVRDIVKGNILLVGEAAGQANAFSKGGIRPGMNAGKWAAEAVINANPDLYRRKWSSSKFNSKLSKYMFEKFKQMNTEEISNHMNPFVKYDGAMSYIVAVLFYTKYLKLYYANYIVGDYSW